MATCVSQEEKIQLGTCNFNIIQLPLDREQALNDLKQHITIILETYERKIQNKVRYYIGKSSVPHSENFDSKNPDTWNKTRIQSRWRTHETNGFTAMVVVAVVTEDTLPIGTQCHVKNAQD